MESTSGSVTWESRLKLHRTTLWLAYQSLGVVYGDLSTSPIYVYKSTFSGSLRPYQEDHEIFGVLSLIFWTLTLIPLCKYIIFVLAADDNGEGGTFALYSLLCRHSKMGFLQTYYAAHERISSYNSELATKETRTSLLIKYFFEKHHGSRVLLLLVVLLGTSMVIGDGILTPTMSILSAVHGIQIKAPGLHENYIVFVACIIMVGLFALQHYGTHRVGFLFAPISIAWLLCIGGVGIYNIFHWNPSIIHALSPYYIYNFFKKAGKGGWSSLGGVLLCITGAEAMFADLGHFSKLSVRIAFSAAVYPSLVLAYMGEAAYLSKHKMDLQNSFYLAIPELVFWPVFVVATLATVVASQAIISATFSIISQCRALSCFPRVKIMHTSNQIHGQIYIPEVNWMLMVLCLSVVIGFRDTNMIANAYGLAAITVMFVTSCLMFLIICTVWKRNVLVAFLFVLIFGSLELLYVSASLAKVHEGGWLPLVISVTILTLMSIWHYGTSKKLEFELENKVGIDSLLRLGPSLGIIRVPGIGLIYSHIPYSVPPIFAHFITKFPAFHKILIFVTLEHVMVPKVPASEHYLISRIGAPEYRLFQCIVRYGYNDLMDSHKIETKLIEQVAEILKTECNCKEPTYLGSRKEELQEFMEAREAGVACMISNTYVVACEGSSFVKKFAVNIVYGFLRRNSRRPATTLGIPHTSLVEVAWCIMSS
ncbi:Potassium transporter [Melia azedarach]|uniref:Potassium transporter n=1 Tax=Melia azedarach TaxID=155640 RepID=A0ACC1X2V9_MELAZ|nr:Potassium transporter [Melia azedarach]